LQWGQAKDPSSIPFLNKIVVMLLQGTNESQEEVPAHAETTSKELVRVRRVFGKIVVIEPLVTSSSVSINVSAASSRPTMLLDCGHGLHENCLSILKE
jgi:hypothetical protein